MTTRIGATVNNEPSMTKQSEADSCNVNLIMKRYEKTGILPEYTAGFFADVSAIGDYRDVQDRLNQGRAIFEQLPAEERAKFENDAAAFLDWCADEANRSEMERLGLVEPAAPVVAPVAPVTGVTPVPPPPAQ